MEEQDRTAAPAGKTKARPILVVDDKASIRLLVKTALELRGYSVRTAANGREGVEMARQENPSLVILDLLMPGMNGYELIRNLREDTVTRDTPIVVMSARTELDAVPIDGVQGILVKPFDISALGELVREHAGPAR